MNIDHTFHIPVMGIGYTIDTPVKISHFGIDSTISLADDILMEKLRKMYTLKNDLPYEEITDKHEDYRAKRITAYLDLIHELCEINFSKLNTFNDTNKDDLIKYFDLLPDQSEYKKEFEHLIASKATSDKINNWLENKLVRGSIDVNIMTKLDKENYKDKELLPTEFNDAHAALRGFGNSKLQSSVVFSAGMNPRLYSYIENFKDFYPDANGYIKKQVILKVSDFRSAVVQGKMLAKKGVWVSEYRIESGLNCGGHAFATEGFLIGPILAEFRDQRALFYDEVYSLFIETLNVKKLPIPSEKLGLKINAQGGVGTSEEHNFLLSHYQIDSIGWGTPFLLVPEVTNVDPATLKKLEEAEEKDLELSNISPLGIPIHNLKGNTKDQEKQRQIDKGRAGSSCPKKYLSLNKEFTTESLCTASRQYQHLKLKELDAMDLEENEYSKRFQSIVEKACICVGLGTSALVVNNLDTKTEGPGISICPGPNMAYFNKKMSLKEICDHIYGRANVITRKDRPNLFIKELSLYLDYLKNQIEKISHPSTPRQLKSLGDFAKNLDLGILYYDNLFKSLKNTFSEIKNELFKELEKSKKELSLLALQIENKIVSKD